MLKDCPIPADFNGGRGGMPACLVACPRRWIGAQMKMRRKGNVPASEDVVVDEAPESDTPEKVLAGVLAVSAEESAEAGSSSSGVTQNGAGAPAAPAGGAPSSDGGADEARPRKGMLGQLLVKRGLVTD